MLITDVVISQAYGHGIFDSINKMVNPFVIPASYSSHSARMNVHRNEQFKAYILSG